MSVRVRHMGLGIGMTRIESEYFLHIFVTESDSDTSAPTPKYQTVVVNIVKREPYAIRKFVQQGGDVRTKSGLDIGRSLYQKEG